MKNHAGALQDLPGGELVAVCDLQADRAAAAAERWGVPAYTNYHDMCRTARLDVVAILTPSGMHPDHVIDIIDRYRLPVIVEKPMALNAADLDRMNAAALRTGVPIFPVYQNRYNAAVTFLKAAVDSGQFGRVALGAVRVRWCRRQAYYDRDPWRGTWAMDGGALTNQGIHYVDLLQHICGGVRTVSARTTTTLVSVEVEDTAVATLDFDRGGLGVIEVTTAARPDDFEAEVSILGEHGAAILGGVACNRLRVFTPDPSQCDLQSEEFPDAYGFGHWPFYRDVVRHLTGGPAHPISMAEGAHAIHLLNAIYRSAEDQQTVVVADHLASARLGRPAPDLHALYETPVDGETR
jgi:UDP-N-acetyl-2-amino-2-deoxyglucuronate dehydrogenase